LQQCNSKAGIPQFKFVGDQSDTLAVSRYCGTEAFAVGCMAKLPVAAKVQLHFRCGIDCRLIRWIRLFNTKEQRVHPYLSNWVLDLIIVAPVQKMKRAIAQDNINRGQRTVILRTYLFQFPPISLWEGAITRLIDNYGQIIIQTCTST
jgi:hypothetical protein